ncbi:hypothetical protein AB4851_01390 [Burkholderia sp. 22PA0099]
MPGLLLSKQPAIIAVQRAKPAMFLAWRTLPEILRVATVLDFR